MCGNTLLSWLFHYVLPTSYECNIALRVTGGLKENYLIYGIHVPYSTQACLEEHTSTGFMCFG